MSVILGLDPDLPRWLEVSAAAGILSLPFGWYSGNRVAAMLHQPNYVYIVDLDTRSPQNALYRIPSDAYGQIEVVEGEVDRVNPHLVFAKDVDFEAMQMRGCWRGTLSDRELMAELSTVYEIRGQLEEDAKRGFAIESQAWMIVKNATRQATKSIVRTFERGTMPSQDGLEVSEAVEDAIEGFDFDMIEEMDDGDLDGLNVVSEESQTDEEPAETEATADD